jgi:hypothetical protein
VTRTPSFDDLVGSDLPAEERERLERVHDLLLQAGPPPELTPRLEQGPTLAMTLARAKPRRQRRLALIAAALVILALAFVAGFVAGNNGDSLTGSHTLKLDGTARAPHALASLVLKNPDAAGNIPMKLSVTGLPKLPPHGYYEVFVTRNGKPWAPCGAFIVKSTGGAVSVSLNAPYDLEKGDGWIVTKQLPHVHEAGPVVLQPAET